MPPAERLYRILLWLYPAEHRQAYGAPMLQHARDLERDARRHGKPLLLRQYVYLVKDGMCNAAIEHWEAIMANNRFTPASWLTVFLAAIPGLLVVFSRSNLLQPGNQLLPILVRVSYLTLLVIGIPLLWIRRRSFPAWALLPAGLLAWFAVYLGGVLLAERWNTFGLFKPFADAIESGIFLLQLIVTVVLFTLLLHGKRLPLSVWLVTGAILLVNLIAAVHYLAIWPERSLTTRIVQFFTVSGIWPVEGFMLVAIGLLAVRQHSLRALLVVIGGFGYMLLDSDYISGPGFDSWAGYTVYAVSLTALYLVLMPVFILLARTRLELALAVFIPFGVFQLARTFIPTIVLHGQLTVPLDSISMILSLVLGWYLYSRVSEQISITQPAASETADSQPAA